MRKKSVDICGYHKSIEAWVETLTKETHFWIKVKISLKSCSFETVSGACTKVSYLQTQSWKKLTYSLGKRFQVLGF